MIKDEERPTDERDAQIARRALLGSVGLAGLGGLVAAILGATGNGKGAGSVGDAARTLAPGRTAFPTPAVQAAATTPMPANMPMNHDNDAAAVTKAFPAKTAGVGLQELPSTIVGGVREFELFGATTDWEITPGKTVKAMAYNGQVPGPIIRATEGERVRIKFTNKLSESTGVHWHGIKVPNAMDGVPFITQPPIEPGGTFVYEFVAGPFGSHMYHSHHDATLQVGTGMLGPFLVMPKDKTIDPPHDKDELFILNDAMGGFTVNGKGFPATAPYTAKLGQRVRFRFMNEGQMIHPIHIHGLTYEVFARDGYPLPQPFRCDTLTVGPGERWDAIVLAEAPGVWAFHCHVLSHAEGPSGMFGMVTALIVS
jgi:FtsP/CotA-like multicopper oxidase with cupredoxin domain